MYFYWTVRIHRKDGQYWTCTVQTGRNLDEIKIIQDFYFEMTGGCKMTIEKMDQELDLRLAPIRDAFRQLFVMSY